MQRYFTKEENWVDDIVTITDEDVHHIVRVMRHNVNDALICIHPNGEVARCQITQIEEETVQLQVVEWLSTNNELPIHVTIAQALPKGKKIDFVLQKGTELGATKFILYEGEHSVTKWNNRNDDKKIKRYEKIVKEASEQSARNQIPMVCKQASLESMVNTFEQYDKVVFAYEEEAKLEDASSFHSLLQTMNENDSLLIFIGPEGGFSNKEVDLLQEQAAQSVRLGKRILRTETASLYALAAISYHFEEILV